MFTNEEFAKMIDHSQLKQFASKDDIKKVCEEAIKYGFFGVCVNSYWVPYASELLGESPVKVVATVGFPLGACLTSIKVQETIECIKAGADEIDMVMNIGALKSGDEETVKQDIKAVVDASREAGQEVNKDVIVKVIIEACYLEKEEIGKASELIVEAGADYVKTSTGFGERGALAGDIYNIKNAIGNKAKIKAAGGISSFSLAKELIEIGIHRIGASSSVKMMEEMKSKYF